MTELKAGDLVKTTHELVIRKDGMTFDEADADTSGKVPRHWYDACDELPLGELCSYVGDSPEGEEYAAVKRGLVGRTVSIRRAYLELVSSIDDAEDDDAESEWH